MPHEVGFGDAVKQEDRCTTAATATVDRRCRRSEIELLEGLEHGG
jgi:hypothetical protein